MTRIAIVEDEAAVREQLAGYVQRYTRQYGTQFEVTMFTDGVEILEDYRPVYDIIFLDVEMQHLDGMETARRIRELDSDVLLIFITNMAQYAAGVVAALHGRGHRVAVPVSVGHAGDEFTGSRLQLRPRVHSGGAGRQRGVAAPLRTLAAAAGYSTAFGTAAGGGLHGGLRLFVLV